MNKTLFGKLNTGEEIYKYTFKNDVAELTVMTRGATITSFKVFGRDIIGGFDTLEDYLLDDSHQGAIIGRVANRIADAKFTMDGKEYHLPKNNGKNCLHGGDGYDHRVWDVKEYTENSITLTYNSYDGEEGFPANLNVEVTYTLTDSSVAIGYKAIPDGRTPIALTNHSYFNLDGLGGTILDHTAEIYADTYTDVDSALIPTGNRPHVFGSVFDLRKAKRIGDAVSDDFIGYDHNFVLNPTVFESFLGKRLGLAARIENEDLSLSVYTDQPGIQFYIGNFLADTPNFRNNVTRVLHGAFCLETQTEPNCINSGIGFYNAGEVYEHLTVYRIQRKA